MVRPLLHSTTWHSSASGTSGSAIVAVLWAASVGAWRLGSGGHSGDGSDGDGNNGSSGDSDAGCRIAEAG